MRPAIDTRKLVRWYDFQAPFYRLWRHRQGHAVAAEAASVLDAPSLPAGAWILDAGCGSGLFSLALARAGRPATVVGVDLSSGMLATARREARERSVHNLRLAAADCCRLPFRDRAFELVVAAGLLPNVDDWALLLGELRRVLRPAGRLLFVEIDRDALGLAGRLLFWGMIQGQRIVARLAPQFRFAERWDVRASTIERGELEQALRASGLRTRAASRARGHLLIEVEKEKEGAT